ncbi:MAG: hypothetical protein HYX53_18735 [Chloroflexi bacterium]|nr:hypothetical protein [Chloroflexota bacterium]
MSKAGQWVQVSGSGDLTGWYLVSTNGGQRFNFPAGFTLAGSVKIYSTASAPALPDLWWGAAGIWDTFANDDAVLYDCANRAVSSFDDANAAAS